MHRWLHQMPEGMLLKSEGRVSNLSDPTASCTLKRYCAENGLPYKDNGWPIPLGVFTRYAQWFQQNWAPHVEEVMVRGIDELRDGFELQLADGTAVIASNVIVSTGLEHAARMPPALSGLPSDLLSHSADHHTLARFHNKDVTVIGAGQSALETAALLAEQGASVRLLARKPSLAWNPHPRTGTRTMYQRLRYPQSNLGEGLSLWFYCTAPMLFRHFPQRLRMRRAFTTLGPAGAWWLKDRVLQRMPVLLSHSVVKAKTEGGRAVLEIMDDSGRISDLATDHVIAATGYRFELERLPFLSRRLKSEVRTIEGQPILSSSFESSVRGLYFTGLASASSFGPAMRFIAGTGYTAHSAARHIAARLRRYGARPSLRLAGTES